MPPAEYEYERDEQNKDPSDEDESSWQYPHLGWAILDCFCFCVWIKQTLLSWPCLRDLQWGAACLPYVLVYIYHLSALIRLAQPSGKSTLTLWLQHQWPFGVLSSFSYSYSYSLKWSDINNTQAPLPLLKWMVNKVHTQYTLIIWYDSYLMEADWIDQIRLVDCCTLWVQHCSVKHMHLNSGVLCQIQNVTAAGQGSGACA